VKPRPEKPLLQFARYVLVGGFNTLFGYCLLALLIWSFSGLGPYSYIYAALLANLIAITVAFLFYKWFVFRTRGNYLIEWIRCLGIYGSSMLVGLVGLPILVPILRSNLRHPERASYIAAAIMAMVSVLFSFLGHKNISFREALAQEAGESRSETPDV
jgi:putative flippase GtrA